MNPEELPLRDLHLPEVSGWWPLAPGWWVVIAIAAGILGWLLWKQFKQWQANAARRNALRQLALIRREFNEGADAAVLGKQLSELLRRGMLAYAPRGEVAGLTGDDWLKWLDQGLEERPFTEGAGRVIETLPYMNPKTLDIDTDVGDLIDAVATRLRKPLEVAA